MKEGANSGLLYTVYIMISMGGYGPNMVAHHRETGYKKKEDAMPRAYANEYNKEQIYALKVTLLIVTCQK
jgi:hypothetical protein